MRKWCWRHNMQTISALLALCERNPPVPVNFPHRMPVTIALKVSLILVKTNECSVNFLVIWDALSLIWCHCNVFCISGHLGRATRQPKWFATQICQYQAFLDWNGNVILTDVIVVATRDVAICCHLNEMFGHWLHWKLQKWQPASGISHDENFAKTTFPFQYHFYETVLYITL